MGTRRRVFGFGDSEKLDAAKVPKITDTLTSHIYGHFAVYGKMSNLYGVDLSRVMRPFQEIISSKGSLGTIRIIERSIAYRQAIIIIFDLPPGMPLKLNFQHIIPHTYYCQGSSRD